MDAGPVLQKNVYKTYRGLVHQLEKSQVDGLAGTEDDLQIGVANEHSGSGKFDQVSLIIACDK